MNYSRGTLILFLSVLSGCKPVEKVHIESNGVLSNILSRRPGNFKNIIDNRENKVQIIYTRIDRDKNNKPKFTDHYFQVKNDEYFYPASTVKLPVAILALQRLNELNIPGLDLNSTMVTESYDETHTAVFNDPNSPDGRPTISNYIKKILLVSDNDAFNRLYEFLGQEYINNTLHKMGFSDVQIIHRLEISMTENQNRYTNPVTFFDENGKLVYQKSSETSKLVYANRNTNSDKYRMGKGFYRRGKLVNEPFDFSQKNRMSLTSLHQILRSIIFPEAVKVQQRFNLTSADYAFLRKYMSMFPRESVYPAYDTLNFHDTYVKFLLYGTERVATNPGIRIFNKVGDAYGFLTDAAYIVDFNNKVEFMLSAVIFCNSDGIFNDDKYDYDSVGFPFLKHLGQSVYEHEIRGHKKNMPVLDKYIFNYFR